jgi:hypothetical protein
MRARHTAACKEGVRQPEVVLFSCIQRFPARWDLPQKLDITPQMCTEVPEGPSYRPTNCLCTHGSSGHADVNDIFWLMTPPKSVGDGWGSGGGIHQPPNENILKIDICTLFIENNGMKMKEFIVDEGADKVHLPSMHSRST